MKKKLQLIALIAIVVFGGFLACVEDIAPVPSPEVLNQVDIDDVRYDGDEDDSLIDPFGPK